MMDWGDSQTLWLNVTNAVLGIVTVVALVAVLGTVGAELLARLKARLAAQRDPHAFQVPGLGLTMADGGEPVDKLKARKAAMEPPSKN